MSAWLNHTHALKRWQIGLILICSQLCIWILAGQIDQDELEKTAGNIVAVAVVARLITAGRVSQ